MSEALPEVNPPPSIAETVTDESVLAPVDAIPLIPEMPGATGAAPLTEAEMGIALEDRPMPIPPVAAGWPAGSYAGFPAELPFGRPGMPEPPAFMEAAAPELPVRPAHTESPSFEQTMSERPSAYRDIPSDWPPAGYGSSMPGARSPAAAYTGPARASLHGEPGYVPPPPSRETWSQVPPTQQAPMSSRPYYQPRIPGQRYGWTPATRPYGAQPYYR